MRRQPAANDKRNHFVISFLQMQVMRVRMQSTLARARCQQSCKREDSNLAEVKLCVALCSSSGG
jgi:hypothetical protein